jgi:AAA15 family ATPase/GTPase
MIHSIKVTNYQSIRDEVTIDFTVNKQAPSSFRYQKTQSPDIRVSLVQAFIGANGSGKTTALRALALARWLITRSFRSVDRRIPVKHFAGYENDTKPTSIEVVFEMKKEIHIYRVQLTSKRILNEELLVRNRSDQKVTNKKIFSRKWNEKDSTYIIKDTGFGITEKFWQGADLGNASIIAVSKRFGNEYASRIVTCWNRSETNIDIDSRFDSYENSRWFAMDYYKSHPKMRGLAEADIRKYDLGISGFEKDGSFSHKYGDTSFSLSFEEESSGTQQLVLIKKNVETVLSKGGVAIIDEPDSFLHPLMLKSIILRFMDEKVNKGKGQLIFSTHDIYVLEFLEKYEVNFVEKHNGVTTVKRLDTFAGVRNTDNFVKKYFDNEYGALPDLTI